MKSINDNKAVAATNENPGVGNNPDVVRPLHSSRSLKACFFDGWRIFALNRLNYLKAFSLPALFAGIAATLLLALPLRFVIEQFVKVKSLSPDAGTTACLSSLTNLDVQALCVQTGIIVLSFLLFNMAKALAWNRIIVFDDTGCLEGDKWRVRIKKTLPLFTKAVAYNVVVLVAVLLLFALAVWGCFKAEHFYPLIIFLPVAYLVSLLFTPGRNAYMLGHLPFSDALRYNITKGFRHYGGCLIVSILIGLPSLIAACVFLLPDVVFAAACAAGRYSMEMGEAAVFPHSLVWLGLVVSVLSFAFACLALSIHSWALVFKTASAFPDEPKSKEE